MAEISEARLAANRENAKKSTGPRTPEGKERSRANAYKHGLAGAGVVVAERMGEEAEKKVQEWTRAMNVEPEGPEAWLVRRAAMDAAKLEAVESCAQARLETSLRRDELYTRTDEVKEAHAASLGRKLLERMGHTKELLVQLRGTKAGCDWLLGRWTELQRRHHAQQAWGPRDLHEAEILLGENILADAMSPRLARLAVETILSNPGGIEESSNVVHCLRRDTWDIQGMIGPDGKPGDPHIIARANERIARFVARKIDELRARRARLAEAESLDDDLATRRLLVDTSADGKLIHRYSTELLRRVHQSLDHLAKLRAARPAAAVAAEPKPPTPSRKEANPPRPSAVPYPVRPPLAASGLDDPSAIRLLMTQPPRNEPDEPESNFDRMIRRALTPFKDHPSRNEADPRFDAQL